MKKTRLNDLYFGVVSFDFPTNELKTWNLFDLVDIKWSVAKYILMPEEDKKQFNPLIFCFGDVWRRAEYEYIINNIVVENNPIKIDIYDLYVRPNKDILLKMINNVSKSSAKEFLAEWKKRYKK